MKTWICRFGHLFEARDSAKAPFCDFRAICISQSFLLYDFLVQRIPANFPAAEPRASERIEIHLKFINRQSAWFRRLCHPDPCLLLQLAVHQQQQFLAACARPKSDWILPFSISHGIPFSAFRGQGAGGLRNLGRDCGRRWCLGLTRRARSLQGPGCLLWEELGRGGGRFGQVETADLIWLSSRLQGRRLCGRCRSGWTPGSATLSTRSIRIL